MKVIVISVVLSRNYRLTCYLWRRGIDALSVIDAPLNMIFAPPPKKLWRVNQFIDMASAKRPRRIPKAKIEALKKRQPTRLLIRNKIVSLGKRTWKVTGVVILLAGFAFAIDDYWPPDTDVKQTTPLNPQNPFTTPFIVTNSGKLTIHNVFFSFQIINLILPEVSFIDVEFQPRTKPIASKLKPGDRIDVECNFTDAVGSSRQFTRIDMNVIIRYDCWFTAKRDTHRFYTKRQSNEQLRWLPRPK